jgi:hypothetical protein
MLAVNHRHFVLLAIVVAGVCACRAQEPSAAEKPQVKVNVLNVCSPSKEEQQEISSALARIPQKPAFTPDFEVDRGRSVFDPKANPLSGAGSPGGEEQNSAASAALEQASSKTAAAQFVRIRHDFKSDAAFSNVQYSFSRDREQMVETLVFRLREPKDVLEISIESSASSVTTAAAMLSAGTPAGRIKLERFGKSSVVLARCSSQNGGPAVDQSAYQPLFASASSTLSDYRALLNTRTLVPAELARIGAESPPHKASGAAHHP